MKNVLPTFVASLLLAGLALAGPVPARAQQSSASSAVREPIQVARKAIVQLSSEDQQAFINSATRVVRLVDAGEIGAMWGSMSPAAWARTSQAEFVNAISELRQLSGPLQSRQPVAVESFESTSDASLRGQFVNVRFRSAFSRSPQATEMVSFHKDEDGQWRLTGYALMQ